MVNDSDLRLDFRDFGQALEDVGQFLSADEGHAGHPGIGGAFDGALGEHSLVLEQGGVQGSVERFAVNEGVVVADVGRDIEEPGLGG